jgi:hypothetical protein
MRSIASTLIVLSFASFPSASWAWSELTHEKLASSATESLRWLDAYKEVKVTPFDKMVADVMGRPAPVGPGAFRFKDPRVREEKRTAYLKSTEAIADPTLRAFARSLLLSADTKIDFKLGEERKPVNVRQVLSRYAGEPDWGMDKGLDASSQQGLMGGTDRTRTSSQGFRHLSFLLGTYGEGPKRAQLFFDLGQKAIAKGHPYWGFRFVAWGIHYLEDMGTPVHTNLLPSLSYLKLKGMFRPTDSSGARIAGTKLLPDLVAGSSQINANYHFLYEHLVERSFAQGGPEADRLEKAARGDGKPEGRIARWLAPKTVEGVARRRAWSRLSTPGIIRNALCYLGRSFREPAPGGASNTVRSVDEDSVEATARACAKQLPNESARTYRARMASGERVLAKTERQMAKNGVAIRRAMGILKVQLGR